MSTKPHFGLPASRALAILCAGVITGCHQSHGANLAPSDAPQHFTGYYMWGPELSAFVPCSDAVPGRRWWVFLPDEELSRRDSLVRVAPPPADSTDPSSYIWFVDFNGWLGALESTGQLGLYNRVLRVSSILGLRRASSKDCGGSRRAFLVFQPSPPSR